MHRRLFLIDELNVFYLHKVFVNAYNIMKVMERVDFMSSKRLELMMERKRKKNNNLKLT